MSFTQREARGLIRKAVKRVPEGENIRRRAQEDVANPLAHRVCRRM